MGSPQRFFAALEKEQWLFKVDGESVFGFALSKVFHFVFAPMVFAILRSFTKEAWAWAGTGLVILAKEAMDLGVLRRYGPLSPQAWLDSAGDIAVSLCGIWFLRTAMEGGFSRLVERLRLRARASALAREPAQPDKPGPSGTLSMAGLTTKAREGLRKAGGRVVLRAFPFKIGRIAGRPPQPLTDDALAIEDRAPFHVSANHCCIDLDRRSGGYVVYDLGSSLGTMVNGRKIGGASGRSETPLDRRVNRVALGGEKGGWVFELTINDRENPNGMMAP
ncbi:MAG: FHA domain-containing protein [Elusimicrobia bacterium]|nr:FHA domain-containing protein [Elusimicrobiota bacterium]